jgi:UDP-glucose 4-epimerase
MKILITGGSGFIGKNLVEFFQGEHDLLAPSHSELDLLDEQAVSEYLSSHAVDAVIHCANVGATRKTDALPIIVDHNVRMFLNLARQESKYSRLIFFGSGAEFDKRNNIVKISVEAESDMMPHTQYGFSKYLCSHFIRHYPKVVNLRLFGVFGKHDDYENRFVSNALSRAVLDLPIVIYKDQLMDFVCVKDLVEITSHFLHAPLRHQFYNISSGQPMHLTEIAEVIRGVSGKDVPVIVQNKGMAPEYTCSTKRLLGELSNFRFAEFRDSIAELYSWYNTRKDFIDKNKLPL